MFSSIRTSESNRQVITELTNKLQLGAENIIARLAFAYSLSLEERLDLKDIQDSKGKEYRSKVLFGDKEEFYIALISQFYNLYKSNQEIPRYIKMHIDHGLELIHEEVSSNPNQLGYDFLLRIIDRGLVEL